MGKRRGGGRGRDDQFGEVGTSQDKQDHHSHAGGRGGGGTGGGNAGGGRGGSAAAAAANITVQRNVPKFLRAHAHLLGAQPSSHHENEFEEDVDGKQGRTFAACGGDASDFEEDDDNDALRRALEENPALASVHPELAVVVDRMKAAELKERGNAAFSKKSYEEAAEIFSQCIELDSTSEVYCSNRAAAYMNLDRFSDGESSF